MRDLILFCCLISGSLFFLGCPDSPDVAPCDPGPCCYENGNYKLADTTCDEWEEFQCLESSTSGAAAQKRTVIQYCNGTSSTCDGDTDDPDWSTFSQCETEQVCETDGNTFAKCTPCTPGPCCDDNGDYKLVDTKCDEWEEFRCSESNTCGADPQKRTVAQYCNGFSSTCDGNTDDPAWSTPTQCESDQICETDEDTFSKCTTCEYICHQGSCKVGYTSVTAGKNHSCGLKMDGSIICWGSNHIGQLDSPPGTNFVAIDTGEHHTCAITKDGIAACWGPNDFGQTDPQPEKLFKIIDAGGSHSCGILDDDTIVCWGAGVDEELTGDTPHYGQAIPPDGKFKLLSAGLYHTCAVSVDNTIDCWGHNDEGQTTPPVVLPESLTAISAGRYHNCVLGNDNLPICWGAGKEDTGLGTSFGQSNPPAETYFTQISAGDLHTGGITPNQSVICWGKDTNDQSDCPSGNDYSQVSAGAEHTCVVKTSGLIECFGLDNYGQASPPEL